VPGAVGTVVRTGVIVVVRVPGVVHGTMVVGEGARRHGYTLPPYPILVNPRMRCPPHPAWPRAGQPRLIRRPRPRESIQEVSRAVSSDRLSVSSTRPKKNSTPADTKVMARACCLNHRSGVVSFPNASPTARNEHPRPAE